VCEMSCVKFAETRGYQTLDASICWQSLPFRRWIRFCNFSQVSMQWSSVDNEFTKLTITKFDDLQLFAQTVFVCAESEDSIKVFIGSL
jgi:hypothetical protein